MAEPREVDNPSAASERGLPDLGWLESRSRELLEQARSGGADEAEVALSASRALSVTARARERESVEHEGDRSASITVYCDKRSGSASTTDLTAHGLRAALDQGIEFAAACKAAGVAAGDPPAQRMQTRLRHCDSVHLATVLTALHEARGDVERALSTLATLGALLARSGPIGLYRGYWPAMARQGPVMVIQMPIVEQFRKALGLDYF